MNTRERKSKYVKQKLWDSSLCVNVFKANRKDVWRITKPGYRKGWFACETQDLCENIFDIKLAVWLPKRHHSEKKAQFPKLNQNQYLYIDMN